jgi:hypothetical protein
MPDDANLNVNLAKIKKIQYIGRAGQNQIIQKLEEVN